MGAATSERSCPAPARADGYARRTPEDTLLYELVREHWRRFLERAEEQGGLPRFVVREFDEYLRCGRLERGVVRLACRRCSHEMLVAFSCKRRGFCPSCLGRRMSDVAAHLVDEVLPEVPLRQWVCSLPWPLRYPMAYDRRLCADVLAAFVGALTRSLRWRAKRELGLRSVEDALVGAVTFRAPLIVSEVESPNRDLDQPAPTWRVIRGVDGLFAPNAGAAFTAARRAAQRLKVRV